MLLDGLGQVVSTYQAAGADPPISFTTSGAFGKVGGLLSLAVPETGGVSLATTLLQPNNGHPIKDYETVFPAAGGPATPGFPAVRQGIDFLGQPAIADVTGDGQAEVVDGGDSNAVHAYQASGQQAAGFPKWTTGWNVFAPVVGDLLGDGTVEVVTAAREGWLFVWQTPGLADANTEWWRGQHDEWNTGNYGVDTGQASPRP